MIELRRRRDRAAMPARVSRAQDAGSGTTGVKRKVSVWPVGLMPSPTIWPQSLMPVAFSSNHPDPLGMSEFRSCMVPLLNRDASSDPVPVDESPTIWPALLMPRASLLTKAPPSVPRSCMTPLA